MTRIAGSSSPRRMTDDTALVTALRTMQVRGAIGESSLELAIAHADQFVASVPGTATTLVDLGSGGGLPGLVIAVRRDDLRVTLVERRHSRADLLSCAVRVLALSDRVTVVADDVKTLAARAPHQFDAVTARSFAAPAITARWAGALLRTGGVLVVSEPPETDASRWPAAVLDAAGLRDLGRELGVRRFLRL